MIKVIDFIIKYLLGLVICILILNKKYFILFLTNIIDLIIFFSKIIEIQSI